MSSCVCSLVYKNAAINRQTSWIEFDRRLRMRFHIIALLSLPILRRSHSLGFERSLSDTFDPVGFQVKSDSPPDDNMVQLSPHDEEFHFTTASGDHEISSNRGNEIGGCQRAAKKNGKGRKTGGVWCPAVYDIQEVQVEECMPAKKLCPIFLEPLCCTGNKRNNGYPFAFDVESCISCMYMYIFFHRSPKRFAVKARDEPYGKHIR